MLTGEGIRGILVLYGDRGIFFIPILKEFKKMLKKVNVMREMLFKNMTSWKDRKRDVFVEEVVTRNGVKAKTTRRCLYFIKKKVRVESPNDIKKLTGIKADPEADKKHFHVLKQHDSNLGTDKMMCKVAGTFYAMINNYLYCIAFVHTYRISFSETKK